MAEISCEVVWADPDLLEIDASISFDGWAARALAYVTREDLEEFAAELDQVAAGGREATLHAGEPQLSHVTLRVFEYGGARRLGVEVELGEGPNKTYPERNSRRDCRLSAPVERGQLQSFAAALRSSVSGERGLARLPLLESWPD